MLGWQQDWRMDQSLLWLLIDFLIVFALKKKNKNALIEFNYADLKKQQTKHLSVAFSFEFLCAGQQCQGPPTHLFWSFWPSSSSEGSFISQFYVFKLPNTFQGLLVCVFHLIIYFLGCEWTSEWGWEGSEEGASFPQQLLVFQCDLGLTSKVGHLSLKNILASPPPSTPICLYVSASLLQSLCPC